MWTPPSEKQEARAPKTPEQPERKLGISEAEEKNRLESKEEQEDRNQMPSKRVGQGMLDL
jgi:hypothetical protein